MTANDATAAAAVHSASSSQPQNGSGSNSGVSNGAGAAGVPFWSRCMAPLRDLLVRHPALVYRVPLGLLALALLVRRVRRTRAQLLAGRRADFWLSSFLPAHAAPSASLPSLWPTHLLYSLWQPVSLVQHALLRDSGLFWTLVDFSTFAGGAIAFGWRPQVLRRFLGMGGGGAREEGRGRETGARYGPHARHTLDVFCAHRHFAKRTANASATVAPATNAAPGGAPVPDASQNSSLPPSRVLVFVHGGAWGSGHASLYRLFASQLDEQLHCVVVCANYRVWPHADAEGQAADVAAVLRWTAENAKRFGGDPDRIVLMGHSSGAHISSLCMLRALQSQSQSQSQTDSDAASPSSSSSSATAAASATASPAACAGTWAIPRLHGFIGLAGVYDISDHYEFESARGVHELSPMAPANGGPSNFAAHSCTIAAAALSPSQRAQLPPCLLLHGLTDRTVPYASSVRFGYALAGALPRQECPLSPESAANLPRAALLAPLPSHALYHADAAAAAAAGSSASKSRGAVSSSASVPIGSSFTFAPPRDSRTGPAASPCPLVHVRLCGSESDPAVQDHATAIFDFMNSSHIAEPALAAMAEADDQEDGEDEEAQEDEQHQRSHALQPDGHGHARWMREAIRHFFAAIPRRTAKVAAVDVAAASRAPASIRSSL